MDLHNLLPLLNNSLLTIWFTFLSRTHQYKIPSSAKGLLKIPIIDIKSYSKYSAKASAITLWNEI